MPLTVAVAAPVAANTPFTFTVVGQQIWHVFSVSATLARAVGGVPTRSVTLTITDGTNPLVTTAALDAGTEPGTLTVTWANAQPAAVASAATGVTLGPLPRIALLPGYKIVGTVVGGVAADQWTYAAVWYDYQPS